MENEPPPPPPPRNTGPHVLPTPRQSGQHPVPRTPSGLHPLPRPPSGQHPRLASGQYALPRHAAGGHPRPVQKRGDLTLLYIFGGILILAAGGYLATRDAWEQNNKAFFLALKRDAEAQRTAQKRSALDKYNMILKMARGHTLKDPAVKDAVEDARIQISAVTREIEVELEAADKKTPAKTVDSDPKRALAYASYAAKSRPFLDALANAKLNSENNADPQKYRDAIAELTPLYTKWLEAIDNTEAGYPSAALFKIAKENYQKAGDFWTIERDKKMPDMLFANVLRRNEWSQAAYVLDKIKICMDARDTLERKRCAPCAGTGKIKCAVCLGDGICAFCKGKTNPAINCCENGVCFACNGRKEAMCLICKGTGEFPPK